MTAERPLRLSTGELAEHFARLCPRQGIDLAGVVALPCPLPRGEAFRAWLSAGKHGGLPYLARLPEARLDPLVQRPWARSILVFGQRYTDGWEAADRAPWEGAACGRPWTDGVARYARGADYHDVLRDGIRAVVAGLRAALWPREGWRAKSFRSHISVDTGPYLEREYAWLAGLGFIGKNTCLIQERLGSGLFLGLAVCELEIDGLPPGGAPQAEPLWSVAPRTRSSASRSPQSRLTIAEPDSPPPLPPASRCGTCRLCQDACPTGALDEPFVLDARRCLSTWTIEWQGRAPAGQSPLQGGLVFGCDICQAVCPWNSRAARRRLSGGAVPDATAPLPAPRPEYRPDPAHLDVDLRGLIDLDASEFRRRFRSSPLWRAHPGGLRRNVIVAVGNTGRRELAARLREIARSDPEPETREAAASALRQLDGE